MCGYVFADRNPATTWKAGRRSKPTSQYPRFRGSKIGLTLTLFEAGVFLVDDVELAITTHNLAIDATLFDGGFDFHDEQKLTSLKQVDRKSSPICACQFYQQTIGENY
ncbi:hypothetical protein GCM10022407_21140 [Hymenobacter antarcticus]|uniref:Uncharacterized protein n=1 Tax=Hymenobacter antarcticus TaxID=486270 RepID=A0ABP7Q2B7_9BACT